MVALVVNKLNAKYAAAPGFFSLEFQVLTTMTSFITLALKINPKNSLLKTSLVSSMKLMTYTSFLMELSS